MSSPTSLTEPQIWINPELDAGVVLVLVGLIATGLLVDYANNKAEGVAKRGTQALVLFIFGASAIQSLDMWFRYTGCTAYCVYLKEFAAAVATVLIIIMIKIHPHSPSLKDAGRLELRNGHLESENTRLQKERDSSIEIAERTTAFLANLSHALRTPLSAIIGMHELLENSNLDDEQKKIVSAISDSANSLLTLVNDVQDVTTIQSGTADLEMEPFAIGNLIREAIATCSESARRKRLFVNTDTDPMLPSRLLGDTRRLRQALVHLMMNAIKLTEKGGVIIRACLKEVNGGIAEIEFSVKDTSRGMLEDEVRYLFEPFNQGSRKSIRSPDARVGLYMSKLLVETMGGNLHVESVSGRGTTISFTINISIADPVPAGVAGSAAGNIVPVDNRGLPPGMVALVAEDNPTLLLLAIRQLESLGVSALGVADGREAVEMATSVPVDLIFMDCHLNGLDGFEASRSIREAESKSGKRTPIVAMTADVLLSDAKRCRDSGMDDVLIKPISIDHLRTKLRRWLPAG